MWQLVLLYLTKVVLPQTRQTLLCRQGVWLVSTLHPALEDDSIAGDKAEVLCPCSGHLDTLPPPSMKGASSEYIYRGGSWSEASEVFKTWPGHEER